MDPYQPILNTHIRTLFEDYIDSSNIPEIDYFAIGVQEVTLKKSISLMSRVEWQKTFTENHFAIHDPIRIATLNTKHTVFTFDDVDHVNSGGAAIMLERKKYGIRHGIVLMDRKASHNYMLTLATAYSKFKEKDFLVKNRANLKRIFKVHRL